MDVAPRAEDPAHRMRLAILSDIHGNLVALEAVLDELGRENPPIARIVCLGDVAAAGPQPSEVARRIRSLGCPVVLGNTDAWLLNPMPRASADETHRIVDAIERWCANQLDDADRAFIQTFEPTVRIALGGGDALLAFHGSPRSFDGVIRAITPDTELAAALDGFHATVFAGGHTHLPMIRRFMSTIVMNPGSVGLPFESGSLAGPTRCLPWAEYAMLEAGSGAVRIELRRTAVNVDRIVTAARASGMPYADWWIRDWTRYADSAV